VSISYPQAGLETMKYWHIIAARTEGLDIPFVFLKKVMIISGVLSNSQ
jgi:hypothetical protein